MEMEQMVSISKLLQTLILVSQAGTVANIFFDPQTLKVSPEYNGAPWNSTRHHLYGTHIMLEEGSHIRLSCIITYSGDDSSCNSSNIYFTRKNIEVELNYIEIISKSQILMDLPNAGRNESSNFHCRFRTEACEERKRHSGTFRVDVGTTPLKPSLESCVIEHWDTMNCTWRPSRKKQHDFTNLGLSNSSLQWRPENSTEQSFQICPDNSNDFIFDYSESCKLDLTINRQLFGERLVIQPLAINALGFNKSDATIIDMKQIVIPTPVVKVLFHKEKGVLSWLSPVPDFYKNEVPTVKPIYLVRGTYTLRLNSTSYSKPIADLQTLETEVVMDVKPYSAYHLQVLCQLTEGGYLSAPTSYHFDTKPEVPSQNPVLSQTFIQSDAHDLSRNVVLYWKEIEPDHRNGEGLFYRALATPSGDSFAESVQGTSSEIYVELSLWFNVSYTVNVTACNVLGCCSLDSRQHVYIPSLNEATNMVTVDNLIVEGASDHVLLHWDNVTGAKSYTVVWCDDNNHEKICKKNFEWQEVPGDEHSLTLNLNDSNYEHYMFGVSVSTEGGLGSSVGKMADCNYHLYGTPVTPTEVKVSFLDMDYGEARLNWYVEQCVRRTRGGYVKQFLISYCPVDITTKECSEEMSVKVVPYSETSTVLRNLQQGVSYAFVVQSQSSTNSSLPSKKVIDVIPADWRTSGAWVGIVLAGLVACILAMVGALVACRSCRSRWKEFASGLQISVPEQTRIMMSNTPSPTSAGPSLDSGRFSYSHDEETASMSPYSNLANKNQASWSYNHSGVSSRPHLVSIQEDSDSDTDEVFDEQKSHCLKTYSLQAEAEKMPTGNGSKPPNSYMQLLPNSYCAANSCDNPREWKDLNNPCLRSGPLGSEPYLLPPAPPERQVIDRSLLSRAHLQPGTQTVAHPTGQVSETCEPRNPQNDCIMYSNMNPQSMGGSPVDNCSYCKMSGSSNSGHDNRKSGFGSDGFAEDGKDSPKHSSNSYLKHYSQSCDVCQPEANQESYIIPDSSGDSQSLSSLNNPFADQQEPWHLTCPELVVGPVSTLQQQAPVLLASGYVKLPTSEPECKQFPENVASSSSESNLPTSNLNSNAFHPSQGYIPVEQLNQFPILSSMRTSPDSTTIGQVSGELKEADSGGEDITANCCQPSLQADGYVQHPNYLWTSTV